MNDFQLLLERLADASDLPAIEWRDRQLSRGSLVTSVTRWRAELARQGVVPGACVAVTGAFSPASVSLLMALFANASVAVPLARGKPPNERLLEIAGAQYVADVDADDAVRWRSRENATQPVLLESIPATGEAGLIVFTSGSTGEPKAVLHSLPRLLKKFRAARRPYRTLTFLSFDHLGGINTLLAALAYGGVVIGSGDRSVDAVCQAIGRHRVELLPATPTFLRMLVIAEAHRHYDLASLRMISYGTEPMPPSTLSALGEVLPGVQFKQTYGLTELGVLPTRPHPTEPLYFQIGGDGIESKVVDGMLWIRTDTAMLGYLNADSPFDEEGWFNTHDLVEVKSGYVRVLGRSTDTINVGGEKVVPSEVEAVLLDVDNVGDATVTGMRNAVTGQIVVAAVRPLREEDPFVLEQRVLAECGRKLPPHKVPAVVHVVREVAMGDRHKKRRHPAVLIGGV